MPWAARGKDGTKYFYSSRRVNGRPAKVYCGAGLAAEEAAAAVERRRDERLEQARRLAAEQANYATAVGPLEDLCQLTDLVTKANLLLAGFRQHDRGTWRRRRDD